MESWTIPPISSELSNEWLIISESGKNKGFTQGLSEIDWLFRLFPKFYDLKRPTFNDIMALEFLKIWQTRIDDELFNFTDFYHFSGFSCPSKSLK